MKKFFTIFLIALSVNAFSQYYSVNTSCSNSFVDISGTGTSLNPSDDGEANITLPFSFNFYGNSSINLRVGNNGGILFGVTTGDLNSGNTALSTGTAAIFPFWDDLYTTGDVYWKTNGTSPNRVTIVQWKTDHFSCQVASSYINVQAQFYETSNVIVFAYSDLTFGCTSYDNGKSATVGIRGSGEYSQFSYNTEFTNTCISYSPMVCTPPSATMTQTCAPDYVSYSVEVVVTALGDALSVDITDGTTTYESNVGTGTYTITGLTTAKTINVQDHTDATCKSSQTFAKCNICDAPSLPSDECNVAPLIDLSQPFVGSTNCSYTPSTGSPDAFPNFCGTIENDSWLSFIAGATSVEVEYEIGECTNNNGVQLAVFSGTCYPGTLTMLSGSCVNPTGENTAGTWNFSGLTIGNSYFIRIDGYAGDKCDYLFTPGQGVVITPDNDQCADAITLNCGDSHIASNILATGADVPAGCSGGGTPSKGVWYTFTGNGGEVTISTDNNDTNFDTEINIFSGTCGALTCIGGDNDSGTGTTSKYTFTTTNALTYYIYADGNLTAEGQLEISLSCTAGPSITVQPVDASVCFSVMSTSFTLTASGATSYQWQINNSGTWTNLTNTAPYSNVTTNTLDISDYTGLIGNQYRCIVTNASGSVNSSVVTIIDNRPVAPAVVTATPSSIISGGSSTLAYSSGSGSAFAWYTGSCGGTSIGTGNDLVVSPASTTTYYGRWENVCGNSTCEEVTVTDSAALYTVSGTLKYDNNPTYTPLQSQTLKLMNGVTEVSTATTNASGVFTFADVPDGIYTIEPTINYDWKGVTAMDVTYYQKDIVNTSELSDLRNLSGNVNDSDPQNSGNDWGLTTMDCTPILQRIITQITSFTAGNFAFLPTDLAVTVSGVNVTGKDIKTVCYGDANASYPFAKNSIQTVNLEFEETVLLQNGQYFSIPVKVKTNLPELSSVTLFLSYNENFFNISEVEMAVDNYSLRYKIDNGKIWIAYSNLNSYNFAENDVLFYLKGTVADFSDSDFIISEATGEFGNISDNQIENITLSVPNISTKEVLSGNEILSEIVEVYPNPANTYINILNAMNYNLKIYDMLGNFVYEEIITDVNSRIEISGLSSGTYFVKISNSKDIINKKIAIVR